MLICVIEMRGTDPNTEAEEHGKRKLEGEANIFELRLFFCCYGGGGRKDRREEGYLLMR